MRTTREGNESERSGLHAGNHAVPLLGVEVRVEVVAGHTRTTVRQRYRNDEPRAIEAIYAFPLPSSAVVCGFAMVVDGRQLTGEVHEREEAFRRYEDALTTGHGGALLEQERPNVFTANVGNLLPGEETVIELELLEPVVADEGALRYCLPTLVAPRYIPGPSGRVPDAARIAPPLGDARYGLSLEVLFDIGCEVDVESPSHSIRAEHTGARTRVSFVQREVALDRDVVITAHPRRRAGCATVAIASVVAHRSESSMTGAFAVTLVPELRSVDERGGTRSRGRTDVVFVLDRSGSMGGASMLEAKNALRLCLRQLDEGDRFAILAFDDHLEAMSATMTTFTRSTLDAADRFIDGIDARGGTEMLEPLLRAAGLAPDGIIVLLTDGQVGNEEEIAREVLARVGSARVHCFGIGTNVSDALLTTLAETTAGSMAMIHPGERVDHKVVAEFARAKARRVTDLRVSFRGVEVGEVAPAQPLALIDGVPFTLFGTYEEGAIGAVELRGMCDGERFHLEVPFDLPARAERPSIVKLWAQARIRDLSRASLVGRRADAMKDRIVRLATEHGLSSKYTSFVVVERRVGARRSADQPETRVVPVCAPAGWSMFGPNQPRTRSYGAAPAPCMPPMRGGGAPAPRMAFSPMPAGGAPAAPRMALSAMAPPPPQSMRHDTLRRPPPMAAAAPRMVASDPIVATLARQCSSGLWEDPPRGAIEATVDALLSLLRLGLSTAHPIHGAQTKKAIEALLVAIGSAPPRDLRLVELALSTMWLLSTGRRTREALGEEARRHPGLEGLASIFVRDEDVRAHVERIAPLC